MYIQFTIGLQHIDHFIVYSVHIVYRRHLTECTAYNGHFTNYILQLAFNSVQFSMKVLSNESRSKEREIAFEYAISCDGVVLLSS